MKTVFPDMRTRCSGPWWSQSRVHCHSEWRGCICRPHENSALWECNLRASAKGRGGAMCQFLSAYFFPRHSRANPYRKRGQINSIIASKSQHCPFPTGLGQKLEQNMDKTDGGFFKCRVREIIAFLEKEWKPKSQTWEYGNCFPVTETFFCILPQEQCTELDDSSIQYKWPLAKTV